MKLLIGVAVVFLVTFAALRNSCFSARFEQLLFMNSSRDNPDMDLLSKTLPISFGDQGGASVSLDIEAAKMYGQNLAENYSAGEPFPHIAIDDFLPSNMLQFICDNFPAAKTEMEQKFENANTGFHKRQISPYATSAELSNIFMFFNSAPVLQFLEQLTSIQGLIPDPYFAGGGLHETRAGGKLAVHSDFRIYKAMHLERRLNIIIYLTENWQQDYGGYLELWDSEMKHCVKSVAPTQNRCVIFNTDADSNHGHPNPLTTPEGVTRRSIALYYYTASEHIYEEIGQDRTHYKARPSDSTKVKLMAKNRALRDQRKNRAARGEGFFSRWFK